MKNSQKTGFNWLLQMAWRDGKASRRKLSLFMASIVLGIAAVVAIQSFGETLKDNIALQSKSLMGADFIIDSDKQPNENLLSVIDSLGGADAKEISFASMAAFPKSGAAKLVQVRGIEGGFPFYGNLETVPAKAGKIFQEKTSSSGRCHFDVTIGNQNRRQHKNRRCDASRGRRTKICTG